MLSWRTFLVLLPSIFFLEPARKPVIGAECESPLADIDFDPASGPSAEPSVSLINDFMPQLSAASLNPNVYDADDLARCLTDEEIVALPAPRLLSRFLEEQR
jgi:hypothetical protein